MVVLGVLALAVAAFALASLERRDRLFSAKDRAYHFRFYTLTRGTNHVILSGNNQLARLKMGLYQSRFRSAYPWLTWLGRAQWYCWKSPTNTAVLWVGWTHQEFVPDLPNASLASLSGEVLSMNCLLTEPTGRLTRLADVAEFVCPRMGEVVDGWAVPGALTNLAGSKLLFQKPNGRELAVLRLQ